MDTQNDSEIRELFSGFNPKINSNDAFMSRLEENLDAVEMLKQSQERFKRNNYKAFVCAGITGFVVGVLTTLVFPYLEDLLIYFQNIIPGFAFKTYIFEYQSVVLWGIAGLASILAAHNVYDLSLSFFSSKREPIAPC